MGFHNGIHCMDLGAMDLLSTVSGLQLRLSSRAQFASSQEDIDNDTETLITTALTSRTAAKPWITRGNAFCLKLSVFFPPQLEDLERDDLLQEIAQAMKDAELWRQLWLDVTKIEATANGPNSAIFTVSLANLNGNDIPRSWHRLAQGVPFHDIRPPPGVRVRELDSVELAMHISQTPSHKKQRTDRIDVAIAHTSEITISDAILNVNASDPEDEVLDWVTLPGFERRSTDAHEDFHSTHPRKRWTPTSTTDDQEASCTNTSRKSEFPSTLKRSHSAGDVRSATTSPTCRRAFVELLDAGLRCAVSREPKALARGMKVVGNESFKHLADVFPSLWAPAYHAAMCSRTILLPTIAAAISSVCGSHTRNQVLKQKAAELTRRAGTQDMRQQEAPDDTFKLQQSITYHLWQVMGRGLFGDETASHMKPPPDCRTESGILKNRQCEPPKMQACTNLDNDEICDLDSSDNDSMLEMDLEPRDNDIVPDWIPPPNFSASPHTDQHRDHSAASHDESSIEDEELLSIGESVESMSLLEEWEANNKPHSETCEDDNIMEALPIHHLSKTLSFEMIQI